MPHDSQPGIFLGPDRGVISHAEVCFPDSFDYGINEHFLKVFVLSYVKFLCDSPFETTKPKPMRIFRGFLKTLTGTHLKLLIKSYSDLADRIIRDEYATGGTDSTVFVLEMRDTPIFKEYHHWYRSRDPKFLKYVLSFLRFGKKINYVDEDLNAVAFRDWQGIEEKLSKLELDRGITDSLRNVLAALPSITDGDILPKFGSGKVAERGLATVADKLNMLGRDRKLKFAFERHGSFNRGPEHGFKPMVFFDDTKTCRPVSRLKFVPKDISKSRSICMEPNAYMFFQQDVWRWMRGGISRSLLGRFIHLDDQAVSRHAALHGSAYLSTDTIDLSSASDSVSVELVKRVFPRDWLFYMLATRTSDVEIPSGEVVRVHKFAPMGSAVCFPTQCLIFAAISIYAAWLTRFGRSVGDVMTREAATSTMKWFLRGRNADTPFAGRYEPPLIFGDDIAVDSRTTDVVVDLLTKLGFQVNTGKSFRGSQNFREACGIFAFAGEDVTPITFRLPFIRAGKKLDAKQYAALIESINNARDAGYHGLASYWLALLTAIVGTRVRLPYTENRDRFGIYTTRKKLPPLSSLRWNADWQLGEERVLGVVQRKRNATAVNADEYLYAQFWRSRIGGDAFPIVRTGSSSIRPQETRIAPVWARCE